jgi:hypothetical protein
MMLYDVGAGAITWDGGGLQPIGSEQSGALSLRNVCQ